jgi:hypothetical protein
VLSDVTRDEVRARVLTKVAIKIDDRAAAAAGVG